MECQCRASGISNDFAAAVDHSVEHGPSQDGDVVSVAIGRPLMSILAQFWERVGAQYLRSR